jgi:small subunit ribosomal protein S4
MGDIRKPRKKWSGPSHPWLKPQLQEEEELLINYGLRNKREIWIAQSLIRKFRHQARALLALPPTERALRERSLIARLTKIGLLKAESTIDSILGLRTKDLLERRLQTIVFRKGLAKTIYQARQLVVHGHIAIAGRRVTSPGYIVPVDEENLIDFYHSSPFKQASR